MSRGSKNVSVRLPFDCYERLQSHAQARNVSLSDLLREQILSHTATSSPEGQNVELIEQLNRVQSLLLEGLEQLRVLRENHAAATTALLVDAGKAEVAEAESWVHENLMGLGEEASRWSP